jgi:dihydrodipicolinate synthase/N-acetylneuraminate lyase
MPPVLAGIYPPVPTFFGADEALDLETLRRHVARLAAVMAPR